MNRIHTINTRIVIAAMLFASFVLGAAAGMAITLYLKSNS